MVIGQWLLSVIPLLLLAQLLGVRLGLSLAAPLVLTASLTLGNWVVLLVGASGAALTLGLRVAGARTPTLVLPLYVPTLIFGAGTVHAMSIADSPDANMSLLAAIYIVAVIHSPR